jgi:hypothetical protein
LPPRPPAAAECGRRVLEYSKVPADAEGLGVLSPVVEYRRRPRRRRRPGYMFVCLLAVGSRARLMAAISCRGGQSPSAPLRVPGARCATGVGCMPRRFRSCSMSDWSSACRSASRRRACAISHHGRRDAVQPREPARDPARAKKPGAGRFARTAASAACELSSCLSSSASCRGAARTWAHGRRRGGAMADLRRLSAGVGCADELKLRHAAPIRS